MLKSPIKQQVWLVLAGLLAVLLIVTVGARSAACQQYRQLSLVLGVLDQQAPELEESVMAALKQADPAAAQSGGVLLARYGYRVGSFALPGLLPLLLTSCLTVTLLLAIYAWQRQVLLRTQRRRIDDLTAYLADLGQGEGSLLLQTNEDMFSQLEDELYKTVRELWQTRESAQQERQNLADNLADIAHQIKTPLTSMNLLAELLEEGQADEERQTYLQKLKSQINRLENLMSALLTLSRLDAGTLVLARDRIDLREAVLAAQEPLAALVRQKQLAIEQEDGRPLYFQGDFHWTVEALVNLLKNCAEHTPVGGRIQLSYEENPLYTGLTIRDNGPGFAKQDLPHLFRRFYKGQNAAADSVGIGLALASSLIKQQNGELQAANRRAGGAEFQIKFYRA